MGLVEYLQSVERIVPCASDGRITERTLAFNDFTYVIPFGGCHA